MNACHEGHEDTALGSAQGNGVVGWLCTYTPIELIWASGFEAQRLIGECDDLEISHSLMGDNICPYVKSCLEEGLRGRAPKVVVFCGCCDSMRRLYDVWVDSCPSDAAILFEVPRSLTEAGVRFYHRSLVKLVKALEELRGREITREELILAFRKKVHLDRMLSGLARSLASSEERYGARELYEFFLDVQRKTSISQIENTSRAERLSECARFAGENSAPCSRPVFETDSRSGRRNIVLSGSFLSPRLADMLFSLEASYSGLDLCSVERLVTWPDEVHDELPGSKEEILEMVARASLSRPPCPRFLPRGRRRSWLKELLVARNAKGIIYMPLMNCDPFLYECAWVRTDSSFAGIPCLVLPSDYKDESLGQQRTRVEAFMETL